MIVADLVTAAASGGPDHGVRHTYFEWLAICRWRAYPEVLDAVRLASPEMEGAAFHLRVGKDCYLECFANGWLAP
jgi:hypothetical protein